MNGWGTKKKLYIVEAMSGGVFSYIVDLARESVSEYSMYIAYAVHNQIPADYKNYFDKRIKLIEVKNSSRAIKPTKDVNALLEAMYAWQNCTSISCTEGEYQETLKLTRYAIYMNNGINKVAFDELLAFAEVPEYPFTVFMLRCIYYQKNPRMFSKVALSLPDVKFLWIDGSGLREKLAAYNMEITGVVNRSTAMKHSMNTNGFLMTSQWEGLLISILEDMFMKIIYDLIDPSFYAAPVKAVV